MFNKPIFTILTAAILLLAGATNSLASPGNGDKNGGGTLALSSEEEHHLLFMREEEKLARDVYDQLFIDYGNRVFDNISNSEQNHMDAIKVLLDKYGLEDPILDPGVFHDESLNDLWALLMSVADDGPIWALVVGAWVEETDIVDIEIAISETEHDDIDSTYESLMCGSRNHLRAFIRQLEANGVTEFADYNIPLGYEVEGYDISIDSEDYWNVAHSEMETDCGGRDDDEVKPRGKGRN